MPRKRKRKQALNGQGDENPLAPPAPENTLDYWVSKRDPRKRDYIYSYKKAKKCAHPRLTALSIGGTWYRCEECNWAYCIVAGYAQPLHNLVLGSAFNIMHFAKEHGVAALQEVMRRPIGQQDGTSHKPALPEGKTFMDALELLEAVDVNTEDRGMEQLKQLQAEQWVGAKEKALEAKKRQEALSAGDQAGPASGAAGEEGVANSLPSVSQEQGEGNQDRDTRGP